MRTSAGDSKLAGKLFKSTPRRSRMRRGVHGHFVCQHTRAAAYRCDWLPEKRGQSLRGWGPRGIQRHAGQVDVILNGMMFAGGKRWIEPPATLVTMKKWRPALHRHARAASPVAWDNLVIVKASLHNADSDAGQLPYHQLPDVGPPC